MVGIRKPSPLIFQLACERLKVPPNQCVFLDDIGINLKAAAGVGMNTIRVGAEDEGGWTALKELETRVGLPDLGKKELSSAL